MSSPESGSVDTSAVSATEPPMRRLLAVLANPPLSTSGQRTLGRVTMAARVIGCGEVAIDNLFPTPSNDVTELNAIGAQADLWLAARPSLLRELRAVDDVLLGWGCSEPSGEARRHHRTQVTWLMGVLESRSVQVWTVGGQPRHPSRWQRYTAREYPGQPFVNALGASLRVGLPGR